MQPVHSSVSASQEPHDSTPTEPQARRMLDEPMALDLHHLKRPPNQLVARLQQVRSGR